MLLAQALAERAAAQDRLLKVTERITAAARIQEGDEKVEDTAQLLAEAEQLIAQIEQLVRQINLTNSLTELDPGVTLTDALARRDALLQASRFYTKVADAAASRHDRYSASEIRFVSTIDIAAVRKKADQASQQYRELDTRIQQANWMTSLLELAAN